MMHIHSKFLAFLALGAMLSACSNNKQATQSFQVSGMKCEFVPDGDTAVVFGKNLTGVKVFFANGVAVKTLASTDTSLSFIVPAGIVPNSKIGFALASDTVYSSFLFRDSRNLLIDFDQHLATWGGYEPFDEEKQPITSIVESADSITKLPVAPPAGCSDEYALLFGKYSQPWSMNQSMWIQYAANPNDGGRGNHSVAGIFEGYPLNQLALKFEVYIPKNAPYKNINTEIFFGPYDAPDKHGRDKSSIYIWNPFKNTGSYCTSGWQTVTIPLTDFVHGVHSADEKVAPINLAKATNFSFVQFGDTTGIGTPLVYMCVDNFRVVPISE